MPWRRVGWLGNDSTLRGGVLCTIHMGVSPIYCENAHTRNCRSRKLHSIGVALFETLRTKIRFGQKYVLDENTFWTRVALFLGDDEYVSELIDLGLGGCLVWSLFSER